MDVAFSARLSGFILIIFLTIGCGSTKREQAETLVMQSSGTCFANMIPHQYIVHWKDKPISVVAADSKEALVNQIIVPHLEEIEFVENDHLVFSPPPPRRDRVSSFGLTGPDDPYWPQKKIQVDKLWSKNVKGEGIIVAVIDSSIELSHAQLKNQIAININEVNDGKDNDGNGLVDDVGGYDFTTNSPMEASNGRHGTHVSGIIVADPALGPIAGVAFKAKVLPLAFMNSEGNGAISNAIRATEYAASRGAKVINASWGGAPCSFGMDKMLADLNQKGIIFVAASGNDDADLTLLPQFPAILSAPNLVTVGASGYYVDALGHDYMATFSNYSKKFVNLLAPGINIWSTIPNNTNTPLSGTSMAAPFVSGVAALLMEAFPQATPSEIKTAILDGVDKGGYPVSSEGRINALESFRLLEKLYTPISSVIP